MAENILETIIPYARSIPVQLTAEKLAPNRKHYIYINGVMCNFYVTESTYDSGEITYIDLLKAGTGYNTSTKINFIGANTRVAKATANVSNGSIIGIDLTDRGSGYKSNVYITITGTGVNANAIPYTSYIKGTTITTNKYGKVVFTMYIPNDNNLKFPSGTLTFTISDHPTNPILGTSVAVCTFVSNGKKEISQPSPVKTTPVYNYNDIVYTPPNEKPIVSIKESSTEGTGLIFGSGGGEYTCRGCTTIQQTSTTGDWIPNSATDTTTVPAMDVNGNIYWTTVKSQTIGMDVSLNFSKKTALETQYGSHTQGIYGGLASASIDSTGNFSISGSYVMDGLPLHEGGGVQWNNNKDGSASFSLSTQFPPGTTFTQAQLNAMFVGFTNDKNGESSAKNITRNFDPTTGTLTLKGTVTEKQDGYGQNYTYSIWGSSNYDITGHEDQFLNTFTQSTVNGVPAGTPTQISFGSVPTNSDVIRTNLTNNQGINNGITINDSSEISTFTNHVMTPITPSIDQIISDFSVIKSYIPPSTMEQSMLDFASSGAGLSLATHDTFSNIISDFNNNAMTYADAKAAASAAIKADTSSASDSTKMTASSAMNNVIDNIASVQVTSTVDMSADLVDWDL